MLKTSLRKVYIVAIMCLFVSASSTIILDAQNNQNKTNTPAPVADSVKVIEPIQLENISAETENTFKLLRNIEDEIESVRNKDFADSSVIFTINSVNKLREIYNPDSVSYLGYRESEDLNLKIRNIKEQLNSSKELLNKSSTLLNNDLTKLNNLTVRWQKTLENASKKERSDKLIEQIQTSIKGITKIKDELNEELNKVLDLTSDITSQIVYLDALTKSINETLNIAKGNIWALNGPPIWELFKSKTDTISVRDQVHDAFEVSYSNINSSSSHRGLNILLFLFTVVVMYVLVRYSKKVLLSKLEGEYNKYLSDALVLLSNPISLAIFLSLLFAEFYISDSQRYAIVIVRWMYLIPIYHIVPKVLKVIPKHIYRPYAFYMLALTLDTLFSNSIITRHLSILTLAIVGLTLSVRLLKQIKHFKKEIHFALYYFSRFSLHLSLLGYSFSIVLVLLGNSAFSDILTQGFFKMIFGGVVFLSLFNVLETSLGALIYVGKHSNSNILRQYPNVVMRKTTYIIGLIMTLNWIFFSLHSFNISDDVYRALAKALSSSWDVGDITFSLGNIVAFFLSIYISVLVSKFIRFILEDEVFTHVTLPRGVPGAVTMIVRLVLIALGFIFACGAAKIDVSNITIIFGALGVGIGFGLQNIFNNLASGLILAFERPIQVGDAVELSRLKLMGVVKEIGIRSSTVRTFDGAEVIVPNGILISNEMINWTLSDKRRRQEIMIGVGYESDLKLVMSILKGILNECEGIEKDPAPNVLLHNYGDSSIDFKLLFWTKFDDGLGIKSDVSMMINEKFAQNGISIPFPQRDLHVVSSNITNKTNDPNNPSDIIGV